VVEALAALKARIFVLDGEIAVPLDGAFRSTPSSSVFIPPVRGSNSFQKKLPPFSSYSTY
jgi:hypothetical protein